LALVDAMGSGEVVEILPFRQLGLWIGVAFVTEKLIEFLLVGAARTLDLSVEL